MNLWESFRNLFVVEGEYQNFGSNELLSVPLIIVGIFVGIAIAFVATVFTKRVLGEMVRKLLSEQVHSPESAKTLSELSLDQHPFICHAVKGNVSLRRVVFCREEEEFLREQEERRAEYEEAKEKNPAEKKVKKFREASFRVDPKRHHFYIPDEYRDMASVKFDKQGTSVGKLILLLAFLLITLILLLVFLPRLMELLDGVVGAFKSASSSSNGNIVS